MNDNSNVWRRLFEFSKIVKSVGNLKKRRYTPYPVITKVINPYREFFDDASLRYFRENLKVLLKWGLTPLFVDELSNYADPDLLRCLRGDVQTDWSFDGLNNLGFKTL